MKIYTPPSEVGDPPAFDHKIDLATQYANEDAWVKELSAYCKKHGTGPNKGKEIYFPVADGCARYMVFKPSALIHIAIGDAWHYQYANRLTAKDVTEKVKGQEGLRAIFS